MDTKEEERGTEKPKATREEEKEDQKQDVSYAVATTSSVIVLMLAKALVANQVRKVSPRKAQEEARRGSPKALAERAPASSMAMAKARRARPHRQWKMELLPTPLLPPHRSPQAQETHL